MRVLGIGTIEDFKKQHAGARKALDRWVDQAQRETWTNFAELRQTFPSADLVKASGADLTVFNIAGNKYRLVAEVDYQGVLVIVDCLMTHADYSKDRWK